MRITVCVIAYNEEKTIRGILQDIDAQDYDHSMMEIILVDSASTDGTKAIMEEFAISSDYSRVQVLDNPKRTLPCGWNVALSAYTGEAIIKVDAHASIPKDFVSKNVIWLKSGENIVGGERPNIVDNPTDWKNTLYLAETSMFGSSIAPYRNNPGMSYVNSLFHAAYRREVFEDVGGFNEHLARTEDNEIHYRMRLAGYKLLFAPDIRSYQHIRGTLGSMLRQKYQNGYWIGLTTGVCPKCLSLYHYVPFLFVLAIILSVPGTVINALLPLYNVVGLLTGIMWGLYWLLAIVMAVFAVVKAKEKRNITNLCLPFLFLMLHMSYGVGTLVGFIKLPKWLKGIK
ncbi:MAG: glycosyltransferase family 2 protein [Lachnospira sp.]|nr:glycosyltransferase family 2 protein [Lachnospira sp.]